MTALRVTALIASILCLAILVTPAVASGPVNASAAAPASDAPTVTAVGIGIAQSQADPLAVAQTLYVNIQTTVDGASVQAAADDMVARLDTIKGALVKVGVPADGIRMAGFNVSPMFAGKPAPFPAEKSPTQPQVSALMLSGNLTADVPSIRLLVAAMNAATANGATSVNANGGKGGAPFGSVQPSAGELAKATDAAVANARTNAEALAAASGRQLGGIRSVSSSQLPMLGCCPPNSGWTVQVMVTFDFAP